MDIHNRVKPAGERLARLINEFRQSPPEKKKRTTALVLPEGIFGRESQGMPKGWQFARRFMDLIDAGVRPAIVLENRAENKSYLQSRGICELDS